MYEAGHLERYDDSGLPEIGRERFGSAVGDAPPISVTPSGSRRVRDATLFAAETTRSTPTIEVFLPNALRET